MDVRRALARWNIDSMVRSPVQRYGFSVLSVVMALGLALVSQSYGFGREKHRFSTWPSL
jgi:hypothetical protein